jgi:REP element-mobilizing transposase RayT
MDDHIFKRHNKTLLLYHLVFPVKYRNSIISEEVGQGLREICIEISKRYEIHFLEVGYEENHVHFLLQSIPSLSVSQICMKVKSITAKELFKRFPEIKKQLWGGSFWTSGYYGNTVGQYGNKDVIIKYIQNQGREVNYQKLHEAQLTLWDD